MRAGAEEGEGEGTGAICSCPCPCCVALDEDDDDSARDLTCASDNVIAAVVVVVVDERIWVSLTASILVDSFL